MPESEKRESELEQGPNVLKSEHLAEEYRPIIASIGNREEHGKNDFFDNVEAFGENVNYRGHPDLLNMRGFKADNFDANMPSYIISPVNEKDKFTKELLDCTSVIAVGRDVSSGKDISVLTHQDPKIFLKEQKEAFTKDLEERLRDLRQKCHEGSVDIVIAGGKLMRDRPDDYKDSLEKLDDIVESVFGFEPLVICGPKYPEADEDDIYFDTQNRRLYIVRPKDSKFSNEPFPSGKAGEMQKKWEEKGIFAED